jgi:hypothetical protein
MPSAGWISRRSENTSFPVVSAFPPRGCFVEPIQAGALFAVPRNDVLI